MWYLTNSYLDKVADRNVLHANLNITTLNYNNIYYMAY